MTTTADLIATTKRHLLGGGREPMNKLAISAGVSDTTWTFEKNTEDINAGDYLCAGLEIVYVWDVNHQSKVVTVERAQEGSDAATHTTTELVYVNPRFSQFAIFEALNQEINDLSAAGLFRMLTKSLTSSASSYIYDLAEANVVDVYDVRLDLSGPENTYPRMPFDWQYGVPTADVPIGPAIWLDGVTEAARTLRVWYKANLATLAGLTDNVETVTGIPSTAVDLIPLGAAARLLGTREARRVQFESQPETRRHQEVPAGATTRASQSMFAYRQQRLSDELARLNAKWPNRRRAFR